MPKFKHKETGKVVNASEEHANQVLRKQDAYEEVEDKPKRSRKKAVTEEAEDE